MNTAGGLEQYAPVQARVYQRSPSTWYQTVTINKGSSDGVAVDDPVVNGQGLVGKVKSVSDGNAVVMLLTDQDFGVSALAPRRGEPGSITPIPGAGGDLLFDLVENAEKIRKGDSSSPRAPSRARCPSVYPRSILIGTVKRIESGDGDLDRRIHVAPAADLLQPGHRAGAHQAGRRPDAAHADAMTDHRRHRAASPCSGWSRRSSS